MNVKCFGCAALLEAGDADALTDAFVAHAREVHAWSYPEQALRNYARNYGEATERVSGDTERLAEIAEVSVYPMGEDRVDDWLRFFDRDGFAGNPDWASCYCLEPHVPAPRDVIGVSCFVIAPPYRRHGVASVLLDRVMADAAGRGASWIEGYPHNKPEPSDAGHFRGPRSMYEARGFQPVEVRERETVMRRPAG